MTDTVESTSGDCQCGLAVLFDGHSVVVDGVLHSHWEPCRTIDGTQSFAQRVDEHLRQATTPADPSHVHHVGEGWGAGGAGPGQFFSVGGIIGYGGAAGGRGGGGGKGWLSNTAIPDQPPEDPRSDWQKEQDMRADLVTQGLLPSPNQCARWVGLNSFQLDPRIEPMQRTIDGFAQDLMRTRQNYDGLLETNNKWAEAAQRRRKLLEYLRSEYFQSTPATQLLTEMFDYALEEDL